MMNFKLKRLDNYKEMILSLNFILIILVIFILIMNLGQANKYSKSEYVILENVRDMSQENVNNLSNFNQCDIDMKKENYLF